MAEGPALSLTVDGKEYIIRFQDFNALEAREFRREMGTGLSAAFADTPDLDTIAGLLWIHRRKTNPRLQYDEVAKVLNYDNLEIEESDGSDGTEEPDPET